MEFRPRFAPDLTPICPRQGGRSHFERRGHPPSCPAWSKVFVNVSFGRQPTTLHRWSGAVSYSAKKRFWWNRTRHIRVDLWNTTRSLIGALFRGAGGGIDPEADFFKKLSVSIRSFWRLYVRLTKNSAVFFSWPTRHASQVNTTKKVFFDKVSEFECIWISYSNSSSKMK